MQILNSIGFYILFLSICFFIGITFQIFRKKEVVDWAGAFAYGFVLYLALIEILCWYCVTFRFPIFIFKIIVTGISISGLGIGIYGVIKQKIKFQKLSNKAIIQVLLTFLFLSILIILTIVFFRSDADDSFYVSNVNLFSQSDRLNPYDSTTGNPGLGTLSLYDFEIWESLMAVFCQMFSIEASVMMHTVLLPVLLFLSMCAYLYLGKALFSTSSSSNTKACLFYIFIVIFFLFGGYSVYSQGSFLLSRLWQGKAIYIHIVFPLLQASIIETVVERKEKTSFIQEYDYLAIKLIICVLAGSALNPTSLYVFGCFIVLSVAVLIVYFKRFDYIKLTVPSLTIAVIVMIGILINTALVNSGEAKLQSVVTYQDIIGIFKNFWGTGIEYMVLYIITIPFIMRSKNVKAKILFVFIPLSMAVFVWNPLAGKLIAQYITTSATYWRLYWLIPANAALSFICVHILERIETKKKSVLCISMIILAIICMVPGKWMFTEENGFQKWNNAEKLPEEVMQFGEIIKSSEKHPLVLAPMELSTTLMQKYTEMELICSRRMYVEDLFGKRGKPEESRERLYLDSFVNGEIGIDDETVRTLIQKYQIDWIILPKNMSEEWDGEEAVKKDESDQYILFSMNS